ncbi:peptidoglycan-binding protein [Embleya scabrispora]|uniref:peptidoglycan-binding protein n=1 Tax=Embleya scabrispora TaxID=159449 RepID=UPI00037383CA|nr:peptidoglycan-binding protein [Embleya scabrispora]MYS85162.1 efflux RND transporter periplasmic adaptor subunit [Streptomyces sp. SID5474]
MSRQRKGYAGRVVGGVATVVVAGVAAAATAGIGLPGKDDAKPPRSTLPPATGTVTRQTLVETTSKTGELDYGETTTINGGKLTGTLTSLAAPGSTVSRGKPLYKLDNRPVVLLYGALPAYRDLAVDTEGADVEQFEQNLKELGYGGFTVDKKYNEATATAVRKWQKANGLDQTGTVELGRVHYALGELRVETDKAALGDAAQPGQAVLTYTGVRRGISVALEMSNARLAKTDTPVTVRLPDGKTVPGKVVKSVTYIDPGKDGGGGAATPTTKLKVTVALDDEKLVAGLDEASVDVAFTASHRENVLTVPAAALLALAEGGYGVQVVEGGAARVVAVETGMFANGRVEVSGNTLTEGTVVGMPS